MLILTIKQSFLKIRIGMKILTGCNSESCTFKWIPQTGEGGRTKSCLVQWQRRGGRHTQRTDLIEEVQQNTAGPWWASIWNHTPSGRGKEKKKGSRERDRERKRAIKIEREVGGWRHTRSAPKINMMAAVCGVTRLQGHLPHQLPVGETVGLRVINRVSCVCSPAMWQHSTLPMCSVPIRTKHNYNWTQACWDTSSCHFPFFICTTFRITETERFQLAVKQRSSVSTSTLT